MSTTQASKIIRAFGTQERLADAIGTRQSTVADWKRRGWVPARRQPQVLEAAAKLGVRLTPADFFPPFHAHQDGEEAGPCR